MPVMTTTMIDYLHHLPSKEGNQTLCGLPIERWEFIGNDNPIDIKYACKKCNMLALMLILKKGKEDANLSS